ncbi:MAG: preprotein translocase subunit YajC [Acidimicrobiia bacterium]
MLHPILAQETATGGGGLSTLLFLGVMVGVFYFLVLRPQRTRMKAQQQMVSELSIGDRVQTIGGIMGVIRRIDDDSVVLDVESGSIRVAKRAVASRSTES